MKVINYFDSDRQEHWLEKIGECDWGAGKYLYELLSKNEFYETVGEGSRLLLLIDGDELMSFCTYAVKDDVQSTELTPWVGFVYTYPQYRGHRYVGLLFNEIGKIAETEEVPQVYISTNEEGLYEKYGCEYKEQMTDIEGEPTRIYVKKFPHVQLVDYSDELKDSVFKFTDTCFSELDKAFEPEGRHSFYNDIGSSFASFKCLLADDEVIGTVGLKKIDDDTAELKALYLHKEYRGLGWGSRLINSAIDEARTLEFKTIVLDSMSIYKDALKLYEKSGFVPTERFNDNPYADIFMKKDL
jgi:GNAT superfamily N-acetyltransferase